MVPLVLPVVLVVFLVGGLAVAGALRPEGGAGTHLVLGVGAVVAVLLLVLGGAGVGLGGRGGDDEDPDEASPSVTPPPGEASGPPPLQAPELRLAAVSPDDLPPIPSVVGDLADGTSIVLTVSGLDAGSRATVHQCPSGARQAASCRPGLPVIVDEHHRATVLVDLEVDFETRDERVDCMQVGCSIVVFGSSRLEALTAFGRAAPPRATVDADPATVAPGGTVVALAEHLPSGADASFAVCRPGGDGTADCGEPTAPVEVTADGRADAQVTVGAGRCPRGGRCAVAVVVDGGVRAYAPLRLIGRAGAGYDDGRLALGLGVGALLLAVAVLLVLRTEWASVEGDPFAGVVLPDDPFADVVDR